MSIKFDGDINVAGELPESYRQIERSIIKAESLQGLAEITLRSLTSLFPFQVACMVMLEDTARTAYPLLSMDDGTFSRHPKTRMPVDELLPPGILSSLDGHHLLQTKEIPRLVSALWGKDPGIDHYLAVPCWDDGEPVAFLLLGLRDTNEVDAAVGNYLRDLADILGVVIPQHRRYERLMARMEDLEYRIAARSAILEQQYRRRAALAEIELAITQPHELDTLLDRITEATIRLLPATGGSSVILWDATAEEFLVRTTTLAEEAEPHAFERVRRTEGVTRWIVDHKKPLVVEDVSASPYGATRMLADSGYQAYIGVPLIVEADVLGVLYAVDELPRRYTEDDIEFLSSLGTRAAVAVSKVALFEKLQAANTLLAEKSRELETVNTDLKEFAYVVSHDLKAPLRGISSLANWLVSDYREELGSAGQELVDLLAHRVYRLYELIDGILTYSQIGRDRLEKNPVDLQVLVSEIIDLLSIPDQIILQIDPLPTINGNRTRLAQIFQNLIGNAVKFNDKEVGRIHVGCHERDRFWEFFVKDNGPGIPEGLHEKVFRLFQTVEEQDLSGSSGIGLAVVKKIIEADGGKIWLESQPGESTTFYFTLPVIE